MCEKTAVEIVEQQGNRDLLKGGKFVPEVGRRMTSGSKEAREGFLEFVNLSH